MAKPLGAIKIIEKAERSEPTLEVSEYHLLKSGVTDKDVVRVRDLVKSLGRKGYQNEITKSIRSVQQKITILPKPLEKPAAERIKRTVGFENTKKELGKWNAIITKNRTAEQLFFPLNSGKNTVKIAPTTEFLNRFRLQSDLQKKLEEVDPTPQEPPPVKEDKYEMTLQEATLKRKEAARLRAQQSYKMAKEHYQSKIKSKKFHRIQRKEKIKQQIKEFEELQKTNPEEALAKLEQLDKSRAEERMSLRHKSTGQWAKNKQIKAKYNKETRQKLAEQLAISRELTQKIKRASDSDDSENEENEMPLVLSNNDKENPWMNDIKTEPEIDEFVKNYRMYWDEKNKKVQKEEKVTKVNRDSKLSVKTCASEDGSVKQNSEELSKTERDGVKINSTKITASQKVKELVKTKKTGKKKTNTRCTIISDVIIPKKRKIKPLNDEQNETKREAAATSEWHVEELQCNGETDSKATKLQDIDDMFDLLEENLKRKVDVRLQKLKKELKTNDKAKKRKKKEKENDDHSSNLEFKESKRKPILDLPLQETISKTNSQQDSTKVTMNMEQESTGKSYNREAEIDPQKYLNVKPKHIKTQLPDLDTCGDALDNSEQEEETHRIMSEAFADDDVVEQFRKEKEEEIKKSQPEVIDLRLPGWGSWAGTNIKKSRTNRKKRMFIMKFPKDAPRKDENKGDVIIYEGDNRKLKEHLVSELPYPFNTVKDFEASIRAPLGRTFVPENAHMRLIQPTVKTKLGQIIQPMTEDVLVKRQPMLKRRVDKNEKGTVKNNNKKKRK